METEFNAAFLGLGKMGGYMAANLGRSSQVYGWNRTPQRHGVEVACLTGAIFCSSIEKAVEDCPIVFTCVSDAPDLEEILFSKDGAVKHALPDTLFVDCSTIGPEAATRIAKKLNDLSHRFLDAPVSGGDKGAREATLTFMVGGNQSDFQQALPSLQTMGKHIHHCGSVGAGQSIKAINQVLCAVNMLAVTEALCLARVLGVNPDQAIEICATGAGGSWALENLASRQARGDFAAGFSISHIRKDLRIAMQAVLQREFEELPAVLLADQMFAQVERLKGGGALGTQAMSLAYEELFPSSTGVN